MYSNHLQSPQPRGYPPPNMLLDDDPGIMSEVETSSTGFRRGNRQRSSLPVVRTTSKTLERPLGNLFCICVHSVSFTHESYTNTKKKLFIYCTSQNNVLLSTKDSDLPF